jgi:long-chain fatty acid transport protein
MAYSYLMEEDVKVSSSKPLAPGVNTTYNAKYENSAHGLGLGLTYRF